MPEKRPPASEILRQMEEPAFLCQCRLVPETSEERLEKVTAIHGLSQSGPGNKPKPPSLLLLLQGPTITFLRTKAKFLFGKY